MFEYIGLVLCLFACGRYVILEEPCAMCDERIEHGHVCVKCSERLQMLVTVIHTDDITGTRVWFSGFMHSLAIGTWQDWFFCGAGVKSCQSECAAFGQLREYYAGRELPSQHEHTIGSENG